MCTYCSTCCYNECLVFNIVELPSIFLCPSSWFWDLCEELISKAKEWVDGSIISSNWLKTAQRSLEQKISLPRILSPFYHSATTCSYFIFSFHSHIWSCRVTYSLISWNNSIFQTYICNTEGLSVSLLTFIKHTLYFNNNICPDRSLKCRSTCDSQLVAVYDCRGCVWRWLIYPMSGARNSLLYELVNLFSETLWHTFLVKSC